MATTKSWWAMQISSPLHGCSLHFCLRYLSLDEGFGHLPKPRVGRNTCRNFSLKPPSQAMEHGVQLVHLASQQSRSQDPVAHGRDSSTVLHERPPFLGLT